MTSRSRVAVRAAQVTAGGALAVLLAACGGAPQMMSLAAACASGNDGSAVAVEGFVSAGGSVSCNNIGGGDYRCNIDLTENADASGAKAGMDIVVGSDHNQMDEPPSSFTDADVKVHTDSGAQAGVGDRVRATGDVSVAPDVCFVTVDKIEKL
jgi:hypothetical protein